MNTGGAPDPTILNPPVLTKMFFGIGDTPVALCCFLRINLWPILGEMAEQGKEPLVLEGGKKSCLC